MLRHVAMTYGLLRSAVIYHGQPLKRRRTRAFYSQLIQPGDLCFDIGAHIGGRLGIFTKLGARVVAIEPQPAFMTVLHRLYGKRPGVTLLQQAIGAAPGHTTMMISDWTPTVSTLDRDWANQVGATHSFRHVRWNHRLEVEVVTLDSLIAAHGIPNFCKIDVEGYELEVLKGLSQPIPALSFEFIRAAPDAAQACLTRLGQLGTYKFNASSGETMRLVFPHWLEATEMHAWLQHPPAPSGDVYARLQ